MWEYVAFGRGLVLGVAVALMAGCTTTTVVTQRVIEQEALLPPPTGPSASGPMVPPGSVALEGSVSLSETRPTELARVDGETGHVLLGTVVSGRIAVGVAERWELGLGLDVGSGKWATPVATDLTDDTFAHTTIVRAGPQLRFLVAGDDRLGLGLNGEVLIGSVPYVRDIRESVTSRTVDAYGYPVSQTSHEARYHQTRRTSVWFWRTGLFGTARPVEYLSLTGGLMVQTYPYFFGSSEADSVCTYPGGRCDGPRDADDVDPFTQQLIWTSYLTVGADLGRATLIAEVHWHFAGEEQIVEPSRVGGELGVRVTF